MTNPASLTNRDLKIGVWCYFILLIFEGALRKWVLPGLATPLLIIRDPFALWLLVKAYRRGLMPSTPYLVIMIAVGVIGIFTALFLGHGSLLIALFGARIMLIHFPLIFAIGSIFNRSDVIKLGKVSLYLCIPIALLVGLQFYSPQSAFVNRGVGGDLEGAGFSGALGYFRPPGTFSFTNGNTLFYSFVSGFVFYFWLVPKQCPRLILITATAALLVVVPLSISRSLFFSVAVTLIFAVLAASRRQEYLGKMVLACIGGLVTLIILSKTSFFNTGIEAFTNRFEAASDHEGGLKGSLGGRYFGSLVDEFLSSFDQPFFGRGLGLGTNVGSLLSSGQRVFLISEGECGRLTGELGPLLGLVVILIRLGISLQVAVASYRKLSSGDLLPWMLLSFVLLAMPQGQWAQPTSLGFSTLSAGLLLATLKTKKLKMS